MAGRRPLPKHVHDARGHAGKRPRQTERENPQPPVAGSDPPEWLKIFPPAVAVWNRSVPRRVELGLHTEFDVETFARRCFWQAVHELGLRLLADNSLEHMLASGLFVMGKSGPMVSPVIGLLYDVQTKLHSEDVEFGGTPKARGSIHVASARLDEDTAREEKFG